MFKFRLQRVLELRAKHEQEVAARLSEAQREAERAHQACEALEAARREGQDRTRGAATVGQLQNLSYVVEQLGHHVEDARRAAQAAETNVQKTRSEFASAVQERRVLDRLRERHLEAWQAEEVQADRAVMDGIALTRFTRPNPSLPPRER